MKVPFFGNDRQFSNLRNEWLKRAEKVWSTGQFLHGKENQELERRLAQKTNRKYCVLLGSCTEALNISLNFLNLPSQSEILVSNYSFLATATPILMNDLTPRFVDIAAGEFHPELEQYKDKETSKTRGIVAVSLYGSLAKMDEIETYCESKGIQLIEDAAQSFGSTVNGRPAGSFGLASCISFDPTKVIAASSSAGALLTNSEELYQYALQKRLHGRDQNLEFSTLGGKSLVSTVEAELLNLKLEHLDEWISKRNQIAKWYDEGLGDLPQLTLPQHSHSTHTYHKYVILAEKRDELFEHLVKSDITPRKHYSKAISEEKVFNGIEASTPRVFKTTNKVISLPLFQELDEKEVAHVINSVREFYS